jgi:undecaprenyl-diphosphatase
LQHRNVRRLAGSALLLGGVLGLWAYLRHVGPLPGDEAVLRCVRSHPELLTSHMLQFLGNLGSTSVALVTVAVAAALVGRRVSWLAVASVLLASAGVLVNEAVRSILGPTPSSESSFGVLVESYPSGHVVYAPTVFGVLAWLAWRHRRRDAAAVLAGLVVVMGPARVLASAHLPSDVLGGYLLGLAWLLVVLAAYDVVQSRYGCDRSA